jgi:hypothetical protein
MSGCHYIRCYSQKTRELESFKVDRSVSVYIKQLECKLRFPDVSKLLKLYPHLAEVCAKDRIKSPVSCNYYVCDYGKVENDGQAK